MRLMNQYSHTIFYKVFAANDTVFFSGLEEGTLRPGTTRTWLQGAHNEFKIEVKKENGVGAFLEKPGRKYAADKDWIIDGAGSMKSPEVVEIHLPGVEKVETVDWDVVDMRTATSPQTITINSKHGTHISMAVGELSGGSDQQTLSVKGSLAGKVGTKAKGGSAKLSAAFTSAVTKHFETSRGTTIANEYEQSFTSVVTLDPGRIHILKVSANVSFLQGEASRFDEVAPFRVVTSVDFEPITPYAYDSPDAIPQKIRDEIPEQIREVAELAGQTPTASP